MAGRSDMTSCDAAHITMNGERKRFSLVWKVILLLFCTYGLLDGAGILSGAYTPDFPHMFTNVSNLFAWGYFFCAVLHTLRGRGPGSRDLTGDSSRTFAPAVKYTATVSLLVTMLIAHFMLFDAMFRGGELVWHLVILHYVVPLMALLDWAFFDEKGKMPLWGPVVWMSLVLAYLAFAMVYVGVFGGYMGGGTTGDITPYPYTFLDPGLSGAGGVAAFCSAMFVLFLLLGYLLLALDRLLARFSRTD